jgi:hypothetical protein
MVQRRRGENSAVVAINQKTQTRLRRGGGFGPNSGSRTARLKPQNQDCKKLGLSGVGKRRATPRVGRHCCGLRLGPGVGGWRGLSSGASACFRHFRWCGHKDKNAYLQNLNKAKQGDGLRTEKNKTNRSTSAIKKPGKKAKQKTAPEKPVPKDGGVPVHAPCARHRVPPTRYKSAAW